ncbi:single-stranded DNA-binding protein [Saccharothrix sp. ST-888]|uniref:single-stranded DNA-binding protein n=1 Tax=Saccharothrix sp. ST-888 TaxID=1427391 RepID=UPI0007C82C3F|nr:single-stranded DNA-binding protein [Saccharothrix sp. ST-888]
MNETLVTMVGNVASTVSYAETSAGVPVANFRMAATERRFDRATGDWVDGETSWITVVAWRRLAANVVSSVSKGDPVVVSGRLRIREWGEEDRRRSAVEIDARVVGHDLGRGTSAFRWAVQARPEQVAGQPVREGLPVPDWIVAAVEAGGSGHPGAADAAAGPAVAERAGAAGAAAVAGAGAVVEVSGEVGAGDAAVTAGAV